MSREQWGHGYHAGLRAAKQSAQQSQIPEEFDYMLERHFDMGWQAGENGLRWRLEHAGPLFKMAEWVANRRLRRHDKVDFPVDVDLMP